MKEILLDVSNEKNLRLELSLIVNEIKKTIKYQFYSYQYKTKTNSKKKSSFRTKKNVDSFIFSPNLYNISYWN